MHWLREIARFELRSMDDNEITIRDNFTDRLIHIYIKSGKLSCDVCERDDCIHIGACFAFKRTAVLLKKHGIKAPRVK